MTAADVTLYRVLRWAGYLRQVQGDPAYATLCDAIAAEPIVDVSQVISAPCGCMHLALNRRGFVKLHLVFLRVPPPSSLPPRSIAPPAPSRRPF